MINIHVIIRKTCVVENAVRRHRADNESINFQATPEYFLCWIAILVLSGGHFGSVKNKSRQMWRKPPHGISIP